MITRIIILFKILHFDNAKWNEKFKGAENQVPEIGASIGGSEGHVTVENCQI